MSSIEGADVSYSLCTASYRCLGRVVVGKDCIRGQCGN